MELVQGGGGVSVLTLLTGELVVPASEQGAEKLRLTATSSTVVAQAFRSGLWVKDDTNFVNVERIWPETVIHEVKIYEFDSDYRLRAISRAKSGEYQREDLWRLKDVVQTRFEENRTTAIRIPVAYWPS